MSRLLRLVAVIALAVLSACGSSASTSRSSAGGNRPADSAPTPGKSSDSGTPGPLRPACQLVTRDEVGATVGNPVGAGVGQGSNCSWSTTVDGGTSTTVTAVRPGPSGVAEGCKALREGQPSEAKHEAVNGVGSSAVWVWQSLTTLTQGSLAACWTDSAVLIVLTGEHDQGALRATATSLAQKVHSHF